MLLFDIIKTLGSEGHSDISANSNSYGTLFIFSQSLISATGQTQYHKWTVKDGRLEWLGSSVLV